VQPAELSCSRFCSYSRCYVTAVRLEGLSAAERGDLAVLMRFFALSGGEGSGFTRRLGDVLGREIPVAECRHSNTACS